MTKKKTTKKRVAKTVGKKKTRVTAGAEKFGD